ncbi:hypothetical protein IQ267_28425 [filamentous cyanobacterium LEGE 07170]|nr:hypothetical protein [filamentous cyanobacterium LEGE 07170]
MLAEFPVLSEDVQRIFEDVQRIVDKLDEVLEVDPSQRSLYFKKLGKKYWAVRAESSGRALGVEGESGISWFWIGTHAEYDELIGTKELST